MAICWISCLVSVWSFLSCWSLFWPQNCALVLLGKVRSGVGLMDLLSPSCVTHIPCHRAANQTILRHSMFHPSWTSLLRQASSSCLQTDFNDHQVSPREQSSTIFACEWTCASQAPCLSLTWLSPLVSCSVCFACCNSTDSQRKKSTIANSLSLKSLVLSEWTGLIWLAKVPPWPSLRG